MDKSAASIVDKIDENDVKEIDVQYVLFLTKVVIDRRKTGGKNSSTKKDEEFINRLMEKFQKQGLMDEFFL